MKKIIPVLISLSAFFMLSCFSAHNFINKDVKPKSKLAVIIGDTKFNTENALYANNVTVGLSAGSKMTVLSQKQVKSVLGSYPERIKGPYKISGMDKPKIDYALHDIDELASIAKKLNVQYIYVFWIPQAEDQIGPGVHGVIYNYIGELIEFPSRRIIAQGEMMMAYLKKGNTNGPKSVEEMCKWYSDVTVKEIIDNTGISK
jgi:hypothetical protein